MKGHAGKMSKWQICGSAPTFKPFESWNLIKKQFSFDRLALTPAKELKEKEKKKKKSRFLRVQTWVCSFASFIRNTSVALKDGLKFTSLENTSSQLRNSPGIYWPLGPCCEPLRVQRLAVQFPVLAREEETAFKRFPGSSERPTQSQPFACRSVWWITFRIRASTSIHYFFWSCG